MIEIRDMGDENDSIVGVHEHTSIIFRLEASSCSCRRTCTGIRSVLTSGIVFENQASSLTSSLNHSPTAEPASLVLPRMTVF